MPPRAGSRPGRIRLPRAVSEFFNRISISSELLQFLWAQKLWWLIPMVVMLLLLGMFLVLAQAAAVVPFLYPLF